MGSDSMVIAVEDLRGELSEWNRNLKFIPTHIERGLKEQGLPVMALSRLIELSHCYPKEAFIESCRSLTPAEYVDANLKACESTSMQT